MKIGAPAMSENGAPPLKNVAAANYNAASASENCVTAVFSPWQG
jgi:hypothetical protein